MDGGVGGGNVGRLSNGIGGGLGMMDGVSRALPCVAKRAIMGGGREARRGCSARGVGSPDVDCGVAWPEEEFTDGD